jgi:hypothetical protein
VIHPRVGFANSAGISLETTSDDLCNHTSGYGRAGPVPRVPLGAHHDPDDLHGRFVVEGASGTAEEIKARIGHWLEISDVKKLRQYYRLLLVVIET